MNFISMQSSGKEPAAFRHNMEVTLKSQTQITPGTVRHCRILNMNSLSILGSRNLELKLLQEQFVTAES